MKSLHEYQRVNSLKRETVSDVFPTFYNKSCLGEDTRETPRKKIVLDRSGVNP